MTLRTFLYKLTFKPPFRQLKAWLLQRTIRARHRQWCRWQARQLASTIHPSIEIRDDSPITLENATLGYGTVIERDTTFWLGDSANARISLGERVYLGRNCYIGSFAPLSIGDNTIVGAYCYIITANHRFSSSERPIRDQGYDPSPVSIGRDVWIGAHVVILPGVTIADHAIIGAGAVVTKSVGTGEIWAGVPARLIGRR